MRPLLLLALLLAPPALVAQKAAKAKPPAAAAYAPDLKLWRLELSPDLGGWSSDRTVNLRLKLVDPKDPAPPKDEPVRRYYDDY